ncbi:MFS transporter [Burkholderia gladioli]|nr:MFS transporter [Burkholderia gladioli]PRG51617.1 hypothetical protein C6V06_18235 [Burkholderia gladioli]
MVGLAAALTPLAGLAIAAGWHPDPVAAAARRASFLAMLRLIWAPGLGMALASAGAATIGGFLALRYGVESWPHAGLGLTAFGCAYIVVRLLFGGLPDRFGGYRTGFVSLLVEAVGLLTIAWANGPSIAFLGACLMGLGYSLVFPSFGVEAMRRVSGDNRGLAIGAYLACFDLGLAVGGPGAGVVAQGFGVPGAFVAAALATLVSLGVLCVDWSRRG